MIAVVEEAQSVLGSSASQGEGPFISWVKEGRKYDLGAVLVTQQPGSIPAEILSQGDNWFVFHLLAEGDLRALQRANAHFSDDLLVVLAQRAPSRARGLLVERQRDALSHSDPGPALREGLRARGPALRPPGRRLLRIRAEEPARPARSTRRSPHPAATRVTLNKTVDATQTFKYAAIRKLAQDARFQDAVRS